MLLHCVRPSFSCSHSYHTVASSSLAGDDKDMFESNAVTATGVFLFFFPHLFFCFCFVFPLTCDSFLGVSKINN